MNKLENENFPHCMYDDDGHDDDDIGALQLYKLTCGLNEAV